jgi:integrase
MGKEKAGEVLIWTKEEYQLFVSALKDRPASYMAFETLYWCGLRLGELLALTPADFDFGG